MKVYVSKRNENVTAKIIKEDEKFKTVVIEYLTGDKAGQNNSITTSTLKRWWKATEIEIENTSVTDVTTDKSETVADTESELSDEEYAKIGLEIAEQAKQKSKEHKDSLELESTVESTESSNSPETLVTIPIIEKLSDLKTEKNNKYKIDDILPKVLSSLHDYVVKPYSTNRNYLVVRTNEEKSKRLGEVDVLKNHITIYLKAKIDKLPENISFKRFVNKSLGNCYHIEYTDNFIDNIIYMLNIQEELL